MNCPPWDRNRTAFLVWPAAALISAISVFLPSPTHADELLPPVSEKARAIHAAGILTDGHNDLPYRLRSVGNFTLDEYDISKRLPSGQTDIPRLREGGLKVQFWSVFIGSTQPNPARTVVEQIDLVKRMVARYPDAFEMAGTVDEIERIVAAGKIASLIGIEGGVAIENNFAQLRAFYELGARYMTLTHNATLDWVDAANDKPKHGGLTEFGERVVKEMNRLGMLVDISHVSAATMDDVLRVTKAPIIASHSSAHAICPVPRNVPDDILKRVKENGGVIMVNFYTDFVVPGDAKKRRETFRDLKTKIADPAVREAEAKRLLAEDPKASRSPRGTVEDVADHIDHIGKVAGIDHVGIGSDFDGITSSPVGLADVSDYPRLTDELLRRGYSESDIHKVLGRNVLRALRGAEAVAKELRSTTKPEVDSGKGFK
jgi:membrane dipeptidase